ncbi:hypothetical protein R1sor_023199 [Riccia sorocarpa]|uniref:C2H2-type domain-containing protein n=1 Tax=Riccia sorocarpa TaxID=122646 RepID=A0ABD3GMS3_9MARC
MQSDDENITVGNEHSYKEALLDLEAGPHIDSVSSMDEEEKHGKGMCKDEKNAVLVEATLEGKEGLLIGEDKLVAESVEKEGSVHGLRKRRGSDVGALKASAIVESVVRRMPEEDRRDTGGGGTRMKETPVDSGSDGKHKTVERKPPKQIKSTVKAAGRRVPGSPQSFEELRTKEDGETNRKMPESLDSFLRTNMRVEPPYLTFSGRPGDKSLPRLRSDVLENHGGKFGRGLKVDGGSDGRDIGGLEDNLAGGADSHSSDLDGVKDMLNASKGMSGFARGPQHSLKVPPGVVAFTQAAAKGTSDLPGWPLLSPSKIALTKCDKCSREFCSSLNYRRHVRVHRKSLTEKKDLTKERSKVAEFWDKLTPEQASVIVNYENMEIEDLSGTVLLKALAGYIQQPGMPLVAQGLVKAGSALIDIVQNKSTVYPLPSERLLSILDEASEKTFLSGGTSVAYQRFVFNGDAGKVGLEERNLVACMGFHVELRLVKAWMADKEAEALRNQQALFKEEEAAEQKRAKLLEKKRMKKMRQKERKVTASQVVQELGNESNDEEGNLPGAEEDDSPTATGSSASSLVSAQDLVNRGTSDVDINEEEEQTEEARDEEPLLVRSKASDEDSGQLSLGVSPPSGLGVSTFFSPEDVARSFVSVSRKGDYSDSVDCSGENKSSNWSSRHADEVAEDIGREARPAQQLGYSRTARSADSQNAVYNRRVDQERVGTDYVRRDSDRGVADRKPMRISRDRMRNDYSDVYQRPVRDGRGYDARYSSNNNSNSLDGGSQSTFKHRRVNLFGFKSELGGSDRSQQYRSKPSGMHRTVPGSGNGQVVWTRKVNQPSPVETKENPTQEVYKLPAEPPKMDGQDMKPEVSDVAPVISVKDEIDPNEGAVTPVVEAISVNEADMVEKGAGSPSSVQSQEEFTGALLVGSLSVPIGKYAADKFVQTRGCPTFSQTALQVQEPSPSEAPQDSLELSRRGETDHAVSATNRNDSHDQALKPQTLTSGLDRPEIGRSVAPGPGHDRVAMKSLSWQAPVSRYVTAKVWRAVGLVGERQDTVSGEDGEEREVCMVDGGEADAMQHRQAYDDHAADECSAEQVLSADDSVGASIAEADGGLTAGTEFSRGFVKEDVPNPPAIVSGLYLCSWSIFVEMAGKFLEDRWRVALSQEAAEKYGAAGAVAKVADGCNPTDVASKEESDQGLTHHSGADPLPCSSSSVVAHSLGKAAHDGGVLLSRISKDTDQPGIEGVTHDHRDQQLDGAGLRERDRSRAASPGRQAAGDSSPVDCERRYTYGVDNLRSSVFMSNRPHGSERGAESRAAGGGGSLGYLNTYAHNRQERWHRNSRDRAPKQRYMPRRRAPTEKNC